MRGLLAISAVATVLTLAMAAPVLRAPTERLFGSELVGRHHDAYTVIQQFENPRAPGPFTQPATDWLGALVAVPLGGVAAYNVVVLLTFPLATLFAYLLARELALPPLGAAVAGLLYGFAPFHVAHAAYHPHISQTQWLPLYLLALWRSAERWTPARATALVTCGLLAVLASFYYGLILGVVTPFALAAWWGFAPHRGTATASARPSGACTRTALTLGAIATVGAAYVARFAPSVLDRPEAFAFPRADLTSYAARWWAYLLPAVDHAVLGDRVRAVWIDYGIGGALVEQQLYLGWAPLLLAAIAAATWLRGPRFDVATRAVPLLLVVAAIALVCSLSPERQVGPLHTVRPSALLYELLPMFRAYARFGQVVGLMVALLAGYGASRLHRRSPKALGVLLAIAAVELAPFPPWRSHDVLPTSAHRWLAGQPERGPILDCVPWHRSEIATGKLLGKPIYTLASPGVPPTAPRLDDCREPGLAGKLRALGFDRVIIRADSPDGRALAARGPEPGMSITTAFDDATVLTVDAQKPPVYVARLDGFSWREEKDGASYRWMRERGWITLHNTTEATVHGHLELQLAAFHVERDATLSTGTGPAITLPVTTDRQWFSIGPLSLPAGPTRLDLEVAGGALVPDRLLGNGDRRELTIALWSWRWTTDG